MSTIYNLVKEESSKIEFLDAEKEKELVSRAKKGEERAKRDLFRANSRYILKTSSAFAKKHKLPLDDCFSSATFGFMKAIEKFDFKKETRLITLASWWIMAELQNELYDSHIIRLPNNKIGKLNKENQRFCEDRDLFDILNASGNTASLDKNNDDDDEGNTLMDKVKSSITTPEEDFLESELQESLKKAMKTLSEREREIVRLSFGLGGAEKKSFSEIGKMMGISKQRVCQIQKEALEKLRNPENCEDFRSFAA